jgi:hypothetical protein
LRRLHDQRRDKRAAVRTLAELARAEPSEIVAMAYGEQTTPIRQARGK